jgi:hypothetical protein
MHESAELSGLLEISPFDLCHSSRSLSLEKVRLASKQAPGGGRSQRFALATTKGNMFRHQFCPDGMR